MHRQWFNWNVFGDSGTTILWVHKAPESVNPASIICPHLLEHAVTAEIHGPKSRDHDFNYKSNFRDTLES